MNRRNTIQCALVLEAVNKLRCHATADEVYDYLVCEHPNISRGTVYRNLQRLCEDGDILKVEVPDGADRYDNNITKHHHIVCEKCKKVFDVDMDYVGDLVNLINDAHGFSISGYDIIFKGICPECVSREHVTIP